MAKNKKNSGIYQQDAILGRFRADARKPQQVNAIVAFALKQGEKRKAYLEERAKNEKPRLVIP
jgi:hypothetical protein